MRGGNFAIAGATKEIEASHGAKRRNSQGKKGGEDVKPQKKPEQNTITLAKLVMSAENRTGKKIAKGIRKRQGWKKI